MRSDGCQVGKAELRPVERAVSVLPSSASSGCVPATLGRTLAHPPGLPPWPHSTIVKVAPTLPMRYRVTSPYLMG